MDKKPVAIQTLLGRGGRQTRPTIPRSSRQSMLMTANPQPTTFERRMLGIWRREDNSWNEGVVPVNVWSPRIADFMRSSLDRKQVSYMLRLISSEMNHEADR